VRLAWIRQATGDPAGAVAAIDGASKAAPGPPGLLNPVPAQWARLMLAASGEEAAAVPALAEALILACPQGYVRVFADEGPPMAALLARLIAALRAGGAAAAVPLGCLARLQRALAAQDTVPEAGRGTLAAVPALVDQLTSRELEVLELLAAGQSNQAIASRLVVTLDTVKKHVSTCWTRACWPTWFSAERTMAAGKSRRQVRPRGRRPRGPGSSLRSEGSTSRLQALTDGFFAVTMTLLVLDLSAGQPGRAAAAAVLRSAWPHLLLYFDSMLILGALWSGNRWSFCAFLRRNVRFRRTVPAHRPY
jgi:DNA-binding CsgD family transcriptional regulator